MMSNLLTKAGSQMIMIVSLAGLLLVAQPIYKALGNNYLKINSFQALMSIEFVNLEFSDALQDDIPDGWSVEAWGGSRERYAVTESDRHSGIRSAMIEHMNQTGAATLAQSFAVIPGSKLRVSVFSKGGSGAIRVQFWNAEDQNWGGGAIKEFNASDIWQQTTMDLACPSGSNDARVLLYGGKGPVLFDDVYAGIINGDSPGENRLINSGFEEDGIPEDPLKWWQQHVIFRRLASLKPREYLSSIAYSNISDLVTGRYSEIRKRAERLADTCVLYPEMTSFLLVQGDRFRGKGGLAAEERLYQLTISLAPNCPQPYAYLAKLYKDHNSYWKASNLYSKASDLSAGTALEGRYAFEAGWIEWTYTGDLEHAVIHLERAAANRDWEPSQWYHGTALFYLARSLEDLGRYNEAMSAYQMVISCFECTEYHSDSKKQLNALLENKPEK